MTTICSGKWIVFEGGEGVGKTTQLEKLFSRLSQMGINCLRTREPGGTPLAEHIRSLFKRTNPNEDAPIPLTELLLVSAARAQHVHTVIQPALMAGKTIICDRFLDSTYVYQCLVGQVQKEVVDTITRPILTNDLAPDLTLILTCSNASAKTRMQKEAHRGADRLDSYGNEIHNKIAAGYQELWEKQFPYPNGRVPKRALISAEGDIETVFARIQTAIEQHLGIEL